MLVVKPTLSLGLIYEAINKGTDRLDISSSSYRELEPIEIRYEKGDSVLTMKTLLEKVSVRYEKADAVDNCSFLETKKDFQDFIYNMASHTNLGFLDKGKEFVAHTTYNETTKLRYEFWPNGETHFLVIKVARKPEEQQKIAETTGVM